MRPAQHVSELAGGGDAAELQRIGPHHGAGFRAPCEARRRAISPDEGERRRNDASRFLASLTDQISTWRLKAEDAGRWRQASSSRLAWRCRPPRRRILADARPSPPGRHRRAGSRPAALVRVRLLAPCLVLREDGYGGRRLPAGWRRGRQSRKADGARPVSAVMARYPAPTSLENARAIKRCCLPLMWSSEPVT